MHRSHGYFVYITASISRALYIGTAADLERRIWQHKNHAIPGFTSRYHVHRLVWFDETSDVREAVRRERQMKKWMREWKVNLIERTNPGWLDLAWDWELEAKYGELTGCNLRRGGLEEAQGSALHREAERLLTER